MTAQMGEEDTATGTVSVPSNCGLSSAVICHACDSYPCVCNEILNGTFALAPKVEAEFTAEGEWKHWINGKLVSQAEYDAWVHRDDEDSHWSEDKRMREMINTRNGRML